MVLQHNSLLTSSNAGKPMSKHKAYYEMKAVLSYEGRLPRYAKVVRGNCVVGAFSEEEHVDQYLWKELPHIRLANLQTYDAQGHVAIKPALGLAADMHPESGLRADPKAVEAFVRQYGLLWGWQLVIRDGRLERYDIVMDDSAPLGSLPVSLEDFENPSPGDVMFYEEASEFARAQTVLRRAWTGDLLTISSMEGDVEEIFELETIQIHYEYIGLKTVNLWKFICYLFLRDHAAGKLGICENPDCPAPYFLKRRRTQKFCESGPCTAYAQRQYALKWWNKEGKKRRTKKSPKSQRRKRQ